MPIDPGVIALGPRRDCCTTPDIYMGMPLSVMAVNGSYDRTGRLRVDNMKRLFQRKTVEALPCEWIYDRTSSINTRGLSTLSFLLSPASCDLQGTLAGVSHILLPSFATLLYLPSAIVHPSFLLHLGPCQVCQPCPISQLPRAMWPCPVPCFCRLLISQGTYCFASQLSSRRESTTRFLRVLATDQTSKPTPSSVPSTLSWRCSSLAAK